MELAKEVVVLIDWPVRVGNLVALPTCWIAGPRAWSRTLCDVFLWITGGFLLLVGAGLTMFSLQTDLGDEGGFAFGLVVLGCLPVAIEFLGLLVIRLVRVRPPIH